MLRVDRVINSIFNSNTYVLSKIDRNSVWLIDVGDVRKLFSVLGNRIVKGVFLTHSHFDHIYGLNELFRKFPECIVYTSEDGKNGLYSDKLNFSFYHGSSFVFHGNKVQIVHDRDQVRLWDSDEMWVWETPGHDKSCLCYEFINYFFTGDSYIPGIKTVTKLKGGNKIDNEKSLIKIKMRISENTVICPGHGEIVTNCCDFNKYE